MFDVGFSELVLIALLALIVLGPKRLPEMARAAGRWMAKLRHFVSTVKQDLDSEMRNAEIMELQKLKQELDETRRIMEDTSGRLMQQISAIPAAGDTPAAKTGAEAVPAALISAAPSPRKKLPKKKSANKSKQTSKPKRAHGRARKTRRAKRG